MTDYNAIEHQKLWQAENEKQEVVVEVTVEVLMRQAFETQDRIEGALRSAKYLDDILHLAYLGKGWLEISYITKNLREAKHWIEDVMDEVEKCDD